MRRGLLVRYAAVALAVLALGCASVSGELASNDPMARKPGEWITWGGDPEFTRYSELDQINARNVDDLQVVWRWKSEPLIGGRPDTNWKATPIYVDGWLYVPTGGSKVASIDPATGQTRWMFTPDPIRVGTRQFTGSSRGVSYWTDGTSKRILSNSIDGRLFSIDAETGKLDPAFGQNGVVDLRQELLEPGDPRPVTDVNSTAPGIVVGDVIVVQVITNDTPGSKTQVPGYVRGYDVRTGTKLWTFHTIPLPGEFGHETWEDESWRYTGNASVWSMMSADPELGYVYLPVESPTNNFWGGQRPGDGLFGESIVCLDARTGKRVWHFQILHHGVWDYDLPAAPILHDIRINGRTIKAVSVLTKQGMNFVFDRVTGEPIWPIEERPVPTSMAVPGEKLSPTQPFPTRPAPYLNLGFHEEDLLDFSPELRASAKATVDQYVQGPMYTPPTLVGPGIRTRGTIVYPHYGGGSNWNGGAFDKETHTLYVPIRSNFMAVGLQPANQERTDWKYTTVGGGGYLKTKEGLPANRPPWAEVVATDMDRGVHVWRKPIGGAPDWVRNNPAVQGLDLDFDNMGHVSVKPSPLVTRTLLFLAESSNIGGDPGTNIFRAYNKRNGAVVAELALPAKTSGAPMTYMHQGRQYVVVAVSEQNHPAELVALALPRPGERPATGFANAPSAPEPAASARPVVAATPEQLTLGAQVYARNCAACHGATGQGAAGPGLRTVNDLDDVRRIIESGAPEMPPMRGLLSDAQIDAVARFVLVRLGGSAQ